MKSPHLKLQNLPPPNYRELRVETAKKKKGNNMNPKPSKKTKSTRFDSSGNIWRVILSRRTLVFLPRRRRQPQRTAAEPARATGTAIDS
ncbi:hypothetical protein EVAR_65780_1 [Eumeta japonica]|uniref:Uncharacterized protein n=1 Tax=Eumeta variegata TaxID=151549 RepID=A0A4C2A5P2_EUMVA|nr:hypothetical protein EVAR_65780_1 [Eumeta japonica]